MTSSLLIVFTTTVRILLNFGPGCIQKHFSNVVYLAFDSAMHLQLLRSYGQLLLIVFQFSNNNTKNCTVL